MVEYISTVPAVYAAPAPVVEYVSPAPDVSIAEPAPTVHAAHDTFVEYISPATAMSIAAAALTHSQVLLLRLQNFCELYVPPPSRKRRPSSVEFREGFVGD